MIILLSGASHTGKSYIAHKLLEKYGYSVLSLDLMKMGLIRSHQTNLTPEDDDELTVYLWQIVREIIKTAIENHQDLIVEGCYIPANWAQDFDESYRDEIHYACIVMTEYYIDNNFDDIVKYASVIENRQHDDGLSKSWLKQINRKYYEDCRKYGNYVILIDDSYEPEIIMACIESRFPS